MSFWSPRPFVIIINEWMSEPAKFSCRCRMVISHSHDMTRFIRWLVTGCWRKEFLLIITPHCLCHCLIMPLSSIRARISFSVYCIVFCFECGYHVTYHIHYERPYDYRITQRAVVECFVAFWTTGYWKRVYQMGQQTILLLSKWTNERYRYLNKIRTKKIECDRASSRERWIRCVVCCVARPSYVTISKESKKMQWHENVFDTMYDKSSTSSPLIELLSVVCRVYKMSIL